ncbi:MAG: alpha/beta hydrolase family protein [Thermocrispum sp.]
MTRVRIDTPAGPAAAELHLAADGSAGMLLGHGAGGGISSTDLVAVTRAAQDAGVHVALVEQPYRVAGRRTPPAANRLDEAWLAIAEDLGTRWFDGMPLVFGGRSSGARVACRTADAGGAVAVLCLAFPLLPPWNPQASRQSELDGVQVPTLVVQGDADHFGCPEAGRHHEIHVVRGNHSGFAELAVLARHVAEWLGRVLRPSR